jgi:2-iminobutanoate/2-iminopropanoate deaminase
MPVWRWQRSARSDERRAGGLLLRLRWAPRERRPHLARFSVLQHGASARAVRDMLPRPVDARRTVVPRQIITAANAPSSPLFAQAVKAGPFILVSGTVGADPRTGRLAGDTIQDQTRQALANCEAILAAAGAGLDDVVEVGILITRPADFDGLNEEYARWFPSDPPTRYVARLGPEPPRVLVSIRMTAHVP